MVGLILAAFIGTPIGAALLTRWLSHTRLTVRSGMRYMHGEQMTAWRAPESPAPESADAWYGSKPYEIRH